MDYLEVRALNEHGQLTAVIKDAPESLVFAIREDDGWRASLCIREGEYFDMEGFTFNDGMLCLLELAARYPTWTI